MEDIGNYVYRTVKWNFIFCSIVITNILLLISLPMIIIRIDRYFGTELYVDLYYLVFLGSWESVLHFNFQLLFFLLLLYVFIIIIIFFAYIFIFFRNFLVSFKFLGSTWWMQPYLYIKRIFSFSFLFPRWDIKNTENVNVKFKKRFLKINEIYIYKTKVNQIIYEFMWILVGFIILIYWFHVAMNNRNVGLYINLSAFIAPEFKHLIVKWLPLFLDYALWKFKFFWHYWIFLGIFDLVMFFVLVIIYDFLYIRFKYNFFNPIKKKTIKKFKKINKIYFIKWNLKYNIIMFYYFCIICFSYIFEIVTIFIFNFIYLFLFIFFFFWINILKKVLKFIINKLILNISLLIINILSNMYINCNKLFKYLITKFFEYLDIILVYIFYPFTKKYRQNLSILLYNKRYKILSSFFVWLSIFVKKFGIGFYYFCFWGFKLNLRWIFIYQLRYFFYFPLNFFKNNRLDDSIDIFMGLTDLVPKTKEEEALQKILEQTWKYKSIKIIKNIYTFIFKPFK